MVNLYFYLSVHNLFSFFLVLLSLMSDHISFSCPMQPVTAQCIVKRDSSTTFLHWGCDQLEGSATVSCDNNLLYDFSCSFGTVRKVTSKCNCSSPVIVSEINFLTPSAVGGNEILSCSDGSVERNISLKIPGMLSSNKCIHTILYNEVQNQQLNFCSARPTHSVFKCLFCRVENS